MTEVLTFSQVKNLATEVARGRPHWIDDTRGFFVYGRWTGKMDAGCFVGVMLDRLGLRNQVMIANAETVGHLYMNGVLYSDHRTEFFLRELQSLNDSGHAWRWVLEKALEQTQRHFPEKPEAKLYVVPDLEEETQEMETIPQPEPAAKAGGLRRAAMTLVALTSFILANRQ